MPSLLLVALAGVNSSQGKTYLIDSNMSNRLNESKPSRLEPLSDQQWHAMELFLKQRQGRKVWWRKCNKEYPSGRVLWEHQATSSISCVATVWAPSTSTWKKAAKQKGIEVHTDMLKRQESLSLNKPAQINTVAKEVGEAALNLSNPGKRGKYTPRVAAWEATERAKLYAQQGWRLKECVQGGWWVSHENFRFCMARGWTMSLLYLDAYKGQWLLHRKEFQLIAV